MDEFMTGTLELPTLGRPMRLGTLYDCRSDQIISPDTTLLDTETVSSQLKVKEHQGKKFTIIRSDSFLEKTLALEINPSLKANIVADLVDIKGSAEYLNDKQSTQSQCRLTLHFKVTNRFEHLIMKQLDSSKIQIPDVFAQGRATHVVTGILYGSNTFIVFDMNCGRGQEDIAVKTLNSLLDQLVTDVEEGERTLKASEANYLHSKVHSDLSLEHHQSNNEGIAKLFKMLPEMSETNAIPIKVWLYPLHNIDLRAARVCSTVSDELTSQAQNFLEGLGHCVDRSNALATDPTCNDFPQFKEKLEFFKCLITKYRSGFQKELARVLPSIRNGSDGEGIIKDMLRDSNLSPFNLTALDQWIQSKRKELSAVKLYVKFLPDVDIVRSRETLDDVLMNPGIDNIVCFTFRLKGRDEGFLKTLSEYTTERKHSNYNVDHWYDDVAVMKDMRLKAKLFTVFYQSNRESICTKFIETGFNDVQCTADGGKAGIGGTVLLYEQGVLTQEDFKPPSHPMNVQCSVIDQNTVSLTWTQPKFGSSNVQEYFIKYKIFRGQNESSEILEEMYTGSTDTSVTIKHLEPSQSIQFQVVAVCPLGVSAESKVSDIVTTLPANPPQKPKARNVTATSITLEWEQPDQSGKDVTIQSYLIKLVVVDNGALHKCTQNIDTRSSAEMFTIHDLEPNTTYEFQVIAIYESGISSSPSVISDVCTTLPASQLGKPALCSITSSSVTVNWTEPALVGKDVKLSEYFIEYAVVDRQQSTNSADSGNKWQQVLIENDNENCIVSNLKPNTTYKARVILVCKVRNDLGLNDVMIPSVNSDPFTTLPAGPPINLTAFQISASEIKVTWSNPITARNIKVKGYRIEYTIGENTQVIAKKTKGPSCNFTISEVRRETLYRICVFALCGKAREGENSTVVNFITRRLLKHDIRRNAICVEPGYWENGEPAILMLPLDTVNQKPGQSQSYSFGVAPESVTQHKVIMVVGVTGSGKSTLINGMINHILEVEWQDNFRFKIVHEVNGSSQANSQTQIITSYTLHHKYHKLPYTLTIIDTPGFGDTRGIQRDKVIIDQIREFFADAASHHIDHIDAIGFVVQASQVRLTPTQKYVFDSILSVFGKDISENILLLVTFADGSPPPVLEAIKEANIPYTGSMFKFNNSALFAKVDQNYQVHNKTSVGEAHDKFDKMFWQMGSQNLEDFFHKIQRLEARSLVLTKEVLEERKRLEVAVQGLQPQIQMGICKLEELRREHQILSQHETEIEANKDFKFEVDIPKSKKVDITGNFITNCNKCHFTCHYPCYIADDANKADCAAMKDGVCVVCPGKCAWDVHFNQQYKFEYYSEKEERTYEEIEARYKDAAGKKLTVEQVIQKQLNDFGTVRKSVFALIANSHQSITRLEEIALKPNPLSAVEYVDLLIEAEKHSGKPGWLDRVQALEDVRKEADIMGKVKQANYDPFAKYTEFTASKQGKKKRNWLSFW